MSTSLESQTIQAISELLDCVEAQLFWMIQFAKEHNVPQARLQSLNHLVTRTRTLFGELQTIETQRTLSDGFIHPKSSDEDYNSTHNKLISEPFRCRAVR